MSTEQNSPRRSSGNLQLPPWLVIALFAAVLGLTLWKNSAPDFKREKQSSPEPTSEVVLTEQSTRQADPQPHTEVVEEASYTIEHQSIRDLNGKVVYQGTINLKPTLDRIARGESNRHRNDGTPFQNREGRLPRRPNGYYKEYVHPTPGEHGPGPQRIIIGQEGDIWYTPDHYRTFVEIKRP